MLIEIHMIQNHAPANLNRDDLGAPKTCYFGGVLRSRISSQCIKRSIRNPGNQDNAHNRGRSIFADAMEQHIGIRTKLFPWLVEQELKDTDIPKEEHARIVMAAQRIATAKEKKQKKSTDEQADKRPKTAQLISFGRGDAKRFIAKLIELRKSDKVADGTSDCYAYFLNPRVGFEELVREQLDNSGLDEKIINKIVKASWLIAKCRMSKLHGDDAPDSTDSTQLSSSETSDSSVGNEPGHKEAELIAETMRNLDSNSTEFKELTSTADKAEQQQLKDDAPVKPKKMGDFISSLKEALTCNAVDIALFGRMTTSDYFDDVEAAMQVAHAISTHEARTEVDYFTAVDDLGRAGGGAGHVDEAMFNSACFYKYFCLDWDQLVKNLSGPEPDEKKNAREHKEWKEHIKPQAEKLAACTLGHFLRAAAMTSPAGKQNSFASHCEPCGILVEIKGTKTPISYANAFAEPIERIGKPDDDTADEKSIEGRSIACLADHVQALSKAYSIDSTTLWYSPKLWRFPFQYWERSEDGKKTIAKLVTDRRFDELDGLVEALVKETGHAWEEVKRVAVNAEVA